MKNKHSYDSLEDYLVTHPNEEASEAAISIVKRYGNTTQALLEKKLLTIPESQEYIKWKEKNT